MDASAITMFEPTPKQREAQRMLGGAATHCLLEGGSRSGKTFWLLRAVAARAQIAAGARAAVLRFRFNHLKASILADTWPKMLELCFPGVGHHTDRSDWYTEFDNGSQVWWGGLDDKERTEKVLGQEHATIYLNECSQISYDAYLMASTRLAQSVKITSTWREGDVGKELKPRMYYDANPPNKGHWLYRMFHLLVEPRSGKKHAEPEDYACLLMNPRDNLANLPRGYIERLAALPKHYRDRFLEGLYAELNPNALFASEWFERWRTETVPEMQRVVIGVDPSGADDDTEEADAIGIVVVAIGTDGYGYVLEDLTITAGPATWGKIAASAAHRYGGTVIGERNFGGAMVKFTVQTAERELGVHVRYKEVTATRGKVVRAEPISALYERGQVRHAGEFRELEDELLAFSTTGYTGQASPNRADAAIWALTELFPGLTRRIADTAAPVRKPLDYDFESEPEGALIV